MKKYIILLVFIGSVFSACNQEGLKELTNDIVYLSFTSDPSKDSTVLSFVAYPSGVINAKIAIESRGHWLAEEREFSVSIDKEKSTFPAEYCVLPEKSIFSAGQARDTISIRLLNFAALKDKTHKLTLKINEGELVKEGDVAYRNVVFILSDKIARPMWWTVFNVGYNGNLSENLAEKVYLGLYSDAKYTMFLEELAKDGVEFDGVDVDVLRKYSIRVKYRIEAFNENPENIAAGLVPLWDEANSQAMTVPVRG